VDRRPYREVYERRKVLCRMERMRGRGGRGRQRGRSSVRKGIYRATVRPYLENRGYAWMLV